MVDSRTAQQVLSACRNNEGWFTSLVKKLVTMETPPNEPASHRKLFEILVDELQLLNYRTEIYPGEQSGGQLFARPVGNTAAGYQLMLGHIDTVWPRGTLEEMPFKRDGNTVSGPGIFDMKAGIGMMLTALKVLKENELAPPLQPVLFINSDEETGSDDSKNRIVLLAKIMKRVYVLEPALDRDGKIKTRRKGVGHFNIRVKGKSSHAGIEPEKGSSAILELSYLIQKLFNLNDPEQGITVNVGKIDGGISTNVVAPASSAEVDVRVLRKKDADRLEREISELTSHTPGTSVEISGGFGRQPMVQNERNRWLWNSAKRCAKLLDIKVKQGTSGGASDGNFTSLYAATLDGLGAVGEGAHSPNEKIYLDETLQRAALLALLLMIPERENEH